MGDASMRALMQCTLLHALRRPAAMSRHPLAVGPTFRLLLLALQVSVAAAHGGWRTAFACLA
jgi:hypothetical protein